MMKLYRIFVQDVGTTGYSGSGFGDIEANTAKEALAKSGAAKSQHIWKFIALPHSRKELWPDGATGEVPRLALSLQGSL